MDSPYVSHLMTQMQVAVDPLRRAALEAEVAMYWARCGEFDRADATANALRAEYGDGRSISVAVMLMTLEALILYFRDLSPRAHDRLSRAHLLAVASKSRSLIALTSAWLAHIDFNFDRFGEMLRAIGSSVDAASAGDDPALCRLSLTLADAFLVCRERGVAKAWYVRARGHALQLGDHASIQALMYNQAALGSFVARLQAIFDPVDTNDLRLLTGEVNNAINYQAVASLLSLRSLLDTALIAVKMLAGDYVAAVSKLESLVGSGSRVAFSDSNIGLQCDLALCYARTGRLPAAEHLILNINRSALESLASDELAVACSSLRDAHRECGRERDAALMDQRCKEAALDHWARMESLRASLSPYANTDVLPNTHE